MKSTIARYLRGNGIALLALFVALGGTSYAAVTITGKNVKNSSLTGKDVKNSSLTGKDVKNSSLSTSDVKNGSLLAGDFKSGQLPAGPKGADGAAGRNGATVVNYRQFVRPNISAASFGDTDVECQPGETAIGGGGGFVAANQGGNGTNYDNTASDKFWSAPSNGGSSLTAAEKATGWRTVAQNTAGAARDYVAYAVCASP